MNIAINEHIKIGNAVLEKDGILAGQLVNIHLSKLKESLIFLTKAFNNPISNQ